MRKQPLDEVAIIATAYPDGVKEALASRDELRLENELNEWNPLVEIELNPQHVEEIITDFGRIVDCIESGEFKPATLEKLGTRYGDKTAMFATVVCRNCDARFSCGSYHRYVLGAGGGTELTLRQYIGDYGPDLDQQEWLSGGLESTRNIEDLE